MSAQEVFFKEHGKKHVKFGFRADASSVCLEYLYHVFYTRMVADLKKGDTKPPVSKFVDLCDTLDNTCDGNGMDDYVSVGKSQYMALINYANEMRGE